MIFVCSYGCLVGPVKNRFISAEWTERTQSRRATHGRRAYYTSVKPTKIKVSPLTGLQMETNYVFHNPRDAI